MGDIAEQILEGSLCQECGAYIDEEKPDHPRSCALCSETPQKKKKGEEPPRDCIQLKQTNMGTLTIEGFTNPTKGGQYISILAEDGHEIITSQYGVEQLLPAFQRFAKMGRLTKTVSEN